MSIMREKDAGRYYRGLKRCFKNFFFKKKKVIKCFTLETDVTKFYPFFF